MRRRWREVPPTAGLPLTWTDFAPGGRPAVLERALAALLEVSEVRLECSGTAALIIALTTLKKASNRRCVIIPAYTCPLVALAVLHCGLRPLLCDVSLGDFDFDPDSLERHANSDTLAIIATHLGGRVADLNTITAIAARCGAIVIEDAAQSLGASLGGRKAGTIAEIGFFSLAAGKGLTLYEGGILVARDPAMRRAFKETSAHLAPYKVVWELRRSLELIGYAIAYRPALLRIAYGFPLRRALGEGRILAAAGDEFSSSIPLHRVGSFRRAVGARSAGRLPAFLETLTAQALERKAALASIPGVTVVDDLTGRSGTWPFLMMLMPTMAARDRAMEHLWTAGLGVSRLFIHALPDYPYLRTSLGDCDVPNARDFADRMLTISNSPWLLREDFDRICSAIAAAVANVN